MIPSMFPQDRRCRGRTLDNPLRRWLAPASRDVRRWQIQPHMQVLDLGTGVGYFAPAILAALGTQGRLLLVDPDAGVLDRARKRLGHDPRVSFLVGSGASIPSVPDESQDRVVLSLVLCCVRDKAGVLDETWRVLRPGGWAVVSYPRFQAGSRGLGVTPAVWAELLGRHPWREALPSWGRVVRQHLLKRP